MQHWLEFTKSIAKQMKCKYFDFMVLYHDLYLYVCSITNMHEILESPTNLHRCHRLIFIMKGFLSVFKSSVFASCSSAPIHHVSESQVLPPWACCSEGGNHSVRPPVVAQMLKTLQPQLDLVSFFIDIFYGEALTNVWKAAVLGRHFSFFLNLCLKLFEWRKHVSL